MRDDPYPARYYGRLVDEPSTSAALFALPNPVQPLFWPRPLQRLLLLLLTLYVCCAIFLIFAVTSYAAPLGSTVPCIEAAEIATR